MKSCIFMVVCVILAMWQAASGVTVSISCEGMESTGGGVRAYQYTLQNVSNGIITLTEFYLGTQDLNFGNYTNWIAPAGFGAVAAVGPWAALGPNYNVMSTTGIKTPHGVIPPQNAFASLGGIVWTGNCLIQQGGTVTFGFDNPNESWDVEWLASDPVGMPIMRTWTDAANITLPIAGPLNVFTNGFVHSPVPEPATMALLGLGLAMLRRKH